jgi:hypothetical protein
VPPDARWFTLQLPFVTFTVTPFVAGWLDALYFLAALLDRGWTFTEQRVAAFCHCSPLRSYRLFPGLPLVTTLWFGSSLFFTLVCWLVTPVGWFFNCLLSPRFAFTLVCYFALVVLPVAGCGLVTVWLFLPFGLVGLVFTARLVQTPLCCGRVAAPRVGSFAPAFNVDLHAVYTFVAVNVYYVPYYGCPYVAGLFLDPLVWLSCCATDCWLDLPLPAHGRLVVVVFPCCCYFDCTVQDGRTTLLLVLVHCCPRLVCLFT